MKLLLAFLAAWAFLLPTGAEAAYSCSISPNGIRAAYDTASTVTTTIQSSVTLNCTRASGDSASMAYSLAADNGTNPTGINNRAFLGPNNYLRYDVYMDGGCATQWKGNTTFNGPLLFPNGQLSATANITYWGCIAAGLAPAAGLYTDTVKVSLSYGPNPQQSTSQTFQVAIATPASCALTSPPGTLNFGTYTALSATPVTGSTGFGVTCTTYLPYTMAVSPTTGTIAGVTYTLAPSASGSTGTGALQGFTVDGTMAAGQAGVCATANCTGQNIHTLTITY